ncbi:DnaJ domain-containing protein [Dactylonectria estremocensis]|uniref:DnaJ domain-containing protein n=1 Tax=Dactylonectria estremocensis TaxID=1079267 RepID=A0A9P9I9J6_9HYPO|nr:DnaJ domain-containing protein [Dactylonectria estremocensis]
MAIADYYQILELSRAAGDEDIKAAFWRLAKVRHPDKNPGALNATANFQLLHEAYVTLHDPLQRQKYDAQYKSPNGRRDEAGGASAQNSNAWPGQCSESPEMRTIDSAGRSWQPNCWGWRYGEMAPKTIYLTIQPN